LEYRRVLIIFSFGTFVSSSLLKKLSSDSKASSFATITVPSKDSSTHNLVLQNPMHFHQIHQIFAK
jgi:alpha/beta superfamily hydrolase